MPTPKKLWSALDALPTLLAVSAEWRQHLGSEFDLLKSCFCALAERATSYPHPAGGEPLVIVEHGPDDIVGVDSDGGTTPLARRDLIVYRFNIDQLLQQLRDLLGLQEISEHLGRGLFLVGEHALTPHGRVPVYLLLATPDNRRESQLNALLARSDGAFVLITATPRPWTQAQRKQLQSRHALSLSLSEMLEWRQGRWQLASTGSSHKQGRDWLNAQLLEVRRDPNLEPSWIRDLFRDQQYKLLKALWNQSEVGIDRLIRALSLQGSDDPQDAVRRRKTATNTNLVKHAEKLGELWEIRQRKRDGLLNYFLTRVDRQK